MQIQQKKEKSIFACKALNICALVLSLLIIFLSTHIRLGEANLGCDPWPECYAQLSFADDVKGLTIVDNEFALLRSFHRSIASLLGLNVILITVMVLRKRKHISPILPLIMFALVVFLSILGIATPTRSMPIVTMGNILGGISLTGVIWHHLLQLNKIRLHKLTPLYYFLIAIIIQLISGAWASANYTAAACPELFSCRQTDNLLHSFLNSFNLLRYLTLDAQAHLLADTSSSIIQFSHRILAIAWLFLVIHFHRKIRRYHSHLQEPMLWVLVLSLAEFALGVVNIISDMPLWPNTLHNLLAVGLLFAVINLLYKSGKNRNSASPIIS